MDIYSKTSDDHAREQAEREVEPLDSNKDYLTTDKVKENQTHYCVSFVPPNYERTEQVESLLFTYFLVEKQSINSLFDLVKEAKDALEVVDNNEADREDFFEIEKKRVEEKLYTTLIKKYVNYKKDQKVYLDGKLVEHFGVKIEDQPLQGALKVRSVHKNATKALTKAKEHSKADGYTVFVGETGKWMPFNPDKYRLENYETTNKELNGLVKGHLEEREKAKKAFGLRTELLKRQGKKIAEDLKNENLENVKNGMFDGPDHFLQRRIPNTDISLTQIDDWTKDPNETQEVQAGEVDGLAGIEGTTKPSLKNVPEVSTEPPVSI